jgi:hypothetical protein
VKDSLLSSELYSVSQQLSHWLPFTAGITRSNVKVRMKRIT